MYYVTSNELYHHGVKGMKWGVRKARKLEAKIQKNRSKADEYDAKAARAIEKGRVKKANKMTANADQYKKKIAKYEKKIENSKKRVEKMLQAKTMVKDVSKATANRGKLAAQRQMNKARDATNRYIENSY